MSLLALLGSGAAPAAADTTRERLVINDALSLHSGVYQLTELQINPPEKRPEWAENADADGALLVRDPLFGNREITGKVEILDTSRDLVHDAVAAISDQFEEAERHPEGIPVVWTPADSTEALTFYMLSGEIDEIPVTIESGYFARLVTVGFTLTCRPFGYGTERSSVVASSTDPMVVLTVSDVAGDVPAEGRLVVTDLAAQNRRYVEWGLEQRYFDIGTWPLIDSSSLITTGFAGSQTTRTGGFFFDGVVRGTLTTTPISICGTGNRSHVGTFRVKARVYTDGNLSDVKLRLAWQEGDSPFAANPYVTPVVVDAFAEVDLGLITIPPAESGLQRWSGRIEAYSATAGDVLDIDYLALIPATEGYGKARSPTRVQPSTSFVARDEFDQTSGSLTGKTAPVGGTWVGAGDADDFTVNTTDKVAERTAVSDTATSIANGRVVTLPTTNAGVVAQVDFKWNDIPQTNPGASGIVLRYTDISNFLACYLKVAKDAAVRQLLIVRVVAGVASTVASVVASKPKSGQWYTLAAQADTTGRVSLWWVERGNALGDPALTGSHTDLAAGGTLDDGTVGFVDQHTSASAATRKYDNFSATALPTTSQGIALYANRELEIRHDSALREDSTGTYWGPPPAYRGSRFYLPPAGVEDRISRIVVKAHRNDVEEAEDSTLGDNLQVQAHWTPRFLVVPR